MRKIVLTFILVLSAIAMRGQICTGEDPVSYGLELPAVKSSEKAQKTMPRLDMEKVRREDREDAANGLPLRFGYAYDVNFDLDNSGEWTELEDGGRLWRLEISCPGALSINLLYDKFRLPEGAKFFVYTSDRKRSMGAFTSKNNRGDSKDVRGYATGLLPGDKITLEYYLPGNTNETGFISVSKVVHGYQGFASIIGEDMPPGTHAGCSIQVNINCPAGGNWQNEKKAVALVVVGGIRHCTGSLINNTN